LWSEIPGAICDAKLTLANFLSCDFLRVP
jgi:hypothetical protein